MANLDPLRVLCVFGTRPEAIKMAPVIRRLRQHPTRLTPLVCVTAQHREMLDVALDLFGIRPDYDLDLMRPNQALTALTALTLTRLDEVMAEVRPDWVLVQGDTTTTMAASLAAYYRRVHVGHIEAGLRSGDTTQPYPEEVNRRMTSVMADLHFAPTESARANLRAEGVADERILVTGNTVIDALREVADRPYDWGGGPLASVPRDKRLILVTSHRRENFGAPLVEVCAALKEVAAGAEDVHLVYPVHLNPRVRGPVFAALQDVANVTLLDPLDYLTLVHLLKAAFFIITDSGGLQEEAPGLGKPVLVLRDVTERPEGVASGTVKLVGTDRRRIVAEAWRLLTDAAEYGRMARAVNPYGDGRASERIVERLMRST